MKTITKKHAQMMTPQMAAKMLERNNNNRSVRQRLVEAYARDMAAGRWKLNGSSVVVGSDGDVDDGQHRLLACIRAGVAFPTFVFHGADSDAHATIDTGAARTGGDELGYLGYKNSNVLAAVCKLQHQLMNDPKNLGYSGVRHTTQEITSVIGACPGISDVVAGFCARAELNRIVTPTFSAFIAYNVSKNHAAECDVFFNTLETGAGAAVRSSVLLLRDQLLMAKSSKNTAKIPRRVVLALIIKAWNKHLLGDRTGTLKWSKNEVFPTLIIDQVHMEAAD